jgi:hypothetical protein
MTTTTGSEDFAESSSGGGMREKPSQFAPIFVALFKTPTAAVYGIDAYPIDIEVELLQDRHGQGVHPRRHARHCRPTKCAVPIDFGGIGFSGGPPGPVTTPEPESFLLAAIGFAGIAASYAAKQGNAFDN